MLQHIAAALTLLDLFDGIERERATKSLFDGELQDLALQLLRPLLDLALRRRQLFPGIVQLLLQLRLVELRARLLLGANHRLAPENLDIDLLLHLERQCRLVVLQPLPLLAQLQLFVSKRCDLAVPLRERLLHLLEPRRHRFFRERAHFRKRRRVRFALFLEQPLEGLRLSLGRTRPLAGQLLRTFLDFGPFGFAHRRDRIGACLLQPLERLPCKSLPKRELVRTARAGDVDVQGQKQSIGAQRRLR